MPLFLVQALILCSFLFFPPSFFSLFPLFHPLSALLGWPFPTFHAWLVSAGKSPSAWCHRHTVHCIIIKMCTKNFNTLSILFTPMCIKTNLAILFTMLTNLRQEIMWKRLFLLRQNSTHSSKNKSTLYNLDSVTDKSFSQPFTQGKKSRQTAQTDWKSCNSKKALKSSLQQATRQSLYLVLVEHPHLSGSKQELPETAGPWNLPTQYGLEGAFETLFVNLSFKFPMFHWLLISLQFPLFPAVPPRISAVFSVLFASYPSL